jgi:hypothetical protein
MIAERRDKEEEEDFDWKIWETMDRQCVADLKSCVTGRNRYVSVRFRAVRSR